MAGEPDRDVGGTRRGGLELPTASLERTPLGPTRGNLIGEKNRSTSALALALAFLSVFFLPRYPRPKRETKI